MAVLMSYHKLVERESKYVSYYWKCITIFVLLLAVVCCITSSLCLSKIVVVYHDHCVLNAELKFKEKAEKSINSISFASSESFSLIENRFGPVSNDTDPVELNFITRFGIDESLTGWGKTSSCDFAIFIPIFQFCFGIILTVMFMICGPGGKAEHSAFLPQPWRIVVPSFIFFLIMTCLSIVNLTNIHTGLDAFCQGFVENTPKLGCLESINYFAIKYSAIKPSVLYIFVMTFSWILLVCWITLLSIMIARILFVIDFQLVRVTIKTCEQEDNDKGNFKVVEPQESDKNGNGEAILA